MLCRRQTPTKAADVPADDVVDPHQPGHPLSVDLPSPGPQLGMDTRGAVSTTVFGVDGADLDDRPLLLGLAFGAGLFGGQVPVVAGAGGAPGLGRSA